MDLHCFWYCFCRSWLSWVHLVLTTGPEQSKCLTWHPILTTTLIKTTWVLIDTATLVIPAYLDVNNYFNIACCSQSITDLCFLGYAVTAGHFSSPNTIDVAAGAPQDSGGGKVGGFHLVSCSVQKLHHCFQVLFTLHKLWHYKTTLSSVILGLRLQNWGNISCEDLSSLRENGGYSVQVYSFIPNVRCLFNHSLLFKGIVLFSVQHSFEEFVQMHVLIRGCGDPKRTKSIIKIPWTL